jgi:hypothetical protein
MSKQKCFIILTFIIGMATAQSGSGESILITY